MPKSRMRMAMLTLLLATGAAGDRTASVRGQDIDREQLLAVPALKLRQPVDVIFRLENIPRRTR